MSPYHKAVRMVENRSTQILGFLFKLIVAILYLFALQNAQASSTDTASADATITVVSDITIAKDSGKDLLFANAARNDAADTIAPADSNAASFTVSGEAGHTYSITLPADGTVVMTTGAGVAADDQIAVNSFTSNPAAGNNGVIGGGGTQTLKVGATRAAIRATQTQANDYTATFNVTVTYY